MASRFHALQVDSTGSDDESPPPSPPPPTVTPTASTTAAPAPTTKKSKAKAKKKASTASPTSSSISATHTGSPQEAARISNAVASQIAAPTPLADVAGQVSREPPAVESSAPTSEVEERLTNGQENGVEADSRPLASGGPSLASLSSISSRPSPSPSVTSSSDGEDSDAEENGEVDLAASSTTAATTIASSPPGTQQKGSLANRLPGLNAGFGKRRDSTSTVDGTVIGSPIQSSFPGSNQGTLRGRKPSRLGGGSIDERGRSIEEILRGDGGDTDGEATPPAEVTERELRKKASREKPQAPQSKDHDPMTKWKSMINRTIFGFLMAGGFIALLGMGPVYMIVLVMASQAIVFSELSSLFEHGYKSSHPEREGSGQGVSLRRQLAREKRKAERERWSKVMSWYFFAVTNYFLYGETIIYYFKHIVLVDAYFIPFARHHRFISFMLYTIGFVGFVANLDRNHLRRQFGLFCWIHMTLVLIVFSSHFIVDNILEGLIWLWIPASLVIMNDVAAYVFGMAFGRTQLIALSPKKTVEGFVGAFFATVVFAYPWSTLFMQSSYLICPVKDLGTSAFSDVSCVPNQVFVWREYEVPQSITGPLHLPSTSIPWAPFQLHSLVMAVFASLVAPFGGFFASGFKRAFNIKDFGDSIPGHGGLTDRFDCQFLMGLFTYVYYSSLIREHHVTVGAVLQTITTGLAVEDQVQVFKDLQRYLIGQGIPH